MTPGRRSRIAAAAAGALVLAGCAAAGKPSDLRGAEEAVLPSALRDLWERHGGRDAWRRHAAVRFSYRLSGPAWREAIEIPEVAFRLRGPRRLWVKLSPGAEPLVLDLEPARGDWAAIRETARARGADSADLELGLRLLPFFLGLPLSTSLGPWEFRTLVRPDGAAVAGSLEVVPHGPGVPVGSTLLSAHGETGLLSEALYAVLFPGPAPLPRLVRFEDYADAGGMRIALRRIHTEVRDRDVDPSIGAAWLPYAPAPDGDERGEGETWSLVEEIRGLAFLDEEAAEKACPIE